MVLKRFYETCAKIVFAKYSLHLQYRSVSLPLGGAKKISKSHHVGEGKRVREPALEVAGHGRMREDLVISFISPYFLNLLLGLGICA